MSQPNLDSIRNVTHLIECTFEIESYAESTNIRLILRACALITFNRKFESVTSCPTHQNICPTKRFSEGFRKTEKLS